MSDTYNYDLCNERHEYIKDEFKTMGDRLKKVENRYFATLLLLIMNLAGIIAILIK